MKMKIPINKLLRVANNLSIKYLVVSTRNTLTNSRMYYPFNKSMKKV